jgi:hypothetical protein
MSQITEALDKAGLKGEPVTFKWRDCDDVPRFLRKLERAQELTRKSKLQIG